MKKILILSLLFLCCALPTAQSVQAVEPRYVPFPVAFLVWLAGCGPCIYMTLPEAYEYWLTQQ